MPGLEDAEVNRSQNSRAGETDTKELILLQTGCH